MASTPGFEPGLHWWEASAFTTVPPLLPNMRKWHFTLYSYVPCDYSMYLDLFFLTKLWRRVIERGSCRCCRFKTVDALYGFAYLLPGSCLESGTLAVSLFGNPIILAFFYKTRRVKETFNYHSRIMLFSLTHNYAKTLLLNQLRKFEERVM